MAFYITADLHLSPAVPELTAAFMTFMQRMKSGDKVIIAGDLFDFFVGIDKQDSSQAAVKQAIALARQQGVSVLFMQGNRDFLLRAKEAAYFGMELLPDYHIIKAPYGDVLIVHGDVLCTNDIKYQRFRRRCRNPLFQHLFLLLPLSTRRKIAAKIRLKSKNAAYKRLNSKIYGPVPQTIEKLLNNFKCSNLIHGHLHIYHRYFGETPSEKSRLSLGYWGSAFSYVRMDGNGLAHVQKPLSILLN